MELVDVDLDKECFGEFFREGFEFGSYELAGSAVSPKTSVDQY